MKAPQLVEKARRQIGNLLAMDALPSKHAMECTVNRKRRRVMGTDHAVTELDQLGEIPDDFARFTKRGTFLQTTFTSLYFKPLLDQQSLMKTMKMNYFWLLIPALAESAF